MVIGFITTSARFTYRLDRLKLRASSSGGPPVKVYNFFDIQFVIDLAHAVITHCSL
jgi:hypothetical protein